MAETDRKEPTVSPTRFALRRGGSVSSSRGTVLSVLPDISAEHTFEVIPKSMILQNMGSQQQSQQTKNASNGKSKLTKTKMNKYLLLGPTKCFQTLPLQQTFYVLCFFLKTALKFYCKNIAVSQKCLTLITPNMNYFPYKQQLSPLQKVILFLWQLSHQPCCAIPFLLFSSITLFFFLKDCCKQNSKCSYLQLFWLFWFHHFTILFYLIY